MTDRYLYVMGGNSGSSGPLTSVERAAVGADGSPGAFSPVSSLIFRRVANANAIVGNTLYVIGGFDGATGDAATIERAIIGNDGSLGTFDIVAGVTPAIPRARGMATVVGNSLYLLGGDVDILNSVEHTALR